MTTSAQQIATALGLPPSAVSRLVSLLDEGNTVPFLARYRKEATGGMDEVQIRAVEAELGRLRELDKRRAAIRESILSQGKLTPALARSLDAATTRTELEELYLPYKQKRRTRATAARELGLEPLAKRILDQPRDGSPRGEARRFLRDGVATVDDALGGARDIVAEVISLDAKVRRQVREALEQHGRLTTKITSAGKKAKDQQFRDYHDRSERASKMPSHRYLAVCRGEAEKVLRVSIELDHDRLLGRLRHALPRRPSGPWAQQLEAALADGYKRLVLPSVTTAIRGELKRKADEVAVGVFAKNLRDLLLASPAGPKPVIGVDPGLRTGCKCACLSATGSLLDTATIYLVKGEDQKRRAGETVLRLVRKHRPFALAVGNGTGGRETQAFLRKVLADAGLKDVLVVSVNEAGASVYSASELARQEMPDQDITIRGAVSIGRRFQDPLAELVKIDPQAIGVGQYQHDIDAKLMARELDAVVESCVNSVGVELNTASAPLLSRVAGIGPKLAEKIVRHRADSGRFARRRELLDVAGLGRKTFEQAAGFLRVADGPDPLDGSGVHPERYALVKTMARDLGVGVRDLVGHRELAAKIPLSRYVSDGVGEPTLRDIVAELGAPGRDPRSTFAPVRFREDVNSLEDLREGMFLVGVVTNVTNFGAFVDVGVHQDGLVHVSQLANHFVRDPHEVVSVGQTVEVRVLEVDLQRKRIALTRKFGG